MLVCVHVYRPYAHNLCIYVHMEHYQIVDKTNFFFLEIIHIAVAATC